MAEEINNLETLIANLDKPEEITLEKIGSVMPSMELSVNETTKEQSIVSDESLLSVYNEILTYTREDRKQIDEMLTTFVNMVVNDGDASSSSKEAVVNLIKIKSDQADKMSKIADLMTRVKLKDKDTFPKYLAANQNNTINIGDGDQKMALINAINKAKKGKR